ncbi:histidine kinase [Desulfitobacterium sp. AusDCA]|uniref:histidine kinase n=1 Tax=Desulfitobacterium sp. AusDCA TaxID=3240383 RepID=UPI003DA744E7
MDKEQRSTDERHLQELRKKLMDIKARWPAHSVKPEMIFQLESLEEEIAILQRRLAFQGEKDEF